jgi:hypothetical protein
MSQDFGLRRFAVLHHAGAGGAGAEGADEPHYDFLFDTTDTSSLVTFRLPDWPLAPGSTHAALKLRDHRRIYLTYEGQISGDRGHVSRVAEGKVRVVQSGSNWLLSDVDDRPFLVFEPVRGDEWQVTRSE